MPENIWLYGFDEVGETKTVGIVIGDTEEEARQHVYDMYNDFGMDDADLDNLIVWKVGDDERYNMEYLHVLELNY